MNTVDYLRSKGVQPSQQRIRIWEALASTKAHPSADAVHRVLSPEIPTLSRTTVYSTLDLFVGLGMAQRLEITGSEVRYDADTSSHAHFRCHACGEVSDLFDLKVPAVSDLGDGSQVERVQLFVTGLCPACAKQA
ncbi:MAG: Fur family transcriptional regulator [Treponema sp.]|nr:Fur family transcriptional regulator [Treponema sp.]